MKLSFAVTAYQETTRGGPSILECLAPAIAHPAVDEIIVSDDGSEDFDDLAVILDGIPKLKFSGGGENQGVFGNKLTAVALASGDWVMNCDSDNVVSEAFIDKFLEQELEPATWYCPSFARPEFDYRAYIGRYDISSAYKLVQAGGLAHCLLNTGNQIVHRDNFLKVFGEYLGRRADLMMPNWLGLSETKRQDEYWHKVFNATDSIIFNTEWLKSGGILEIVGGLEYDHFWTGGDDSNYNRAPAEKGRLNELVLDDLLRASLG